MNLSEQAAWIVEKMLSIKATKKEYMSFTANLHTDNAIHWQVYTESLSHNSFTDFEKCQKFMNNIVDGTALKERKLLLKKQKDGFKEMIRCCKDSIAKIEKTLNEK